MIESNLSNSESVVQIGGLTRRFGSTVALDDVSLSVPRGVVFGLVGVNGAGKTTLLKHVLGLLKAQTGRVRVFGRDPVADPVAVLSKIGYLSEDRELPEWMRLEELLHYTRSFYPNWDDRFAKELCGMFELDLTKKVKHLSRGQLARSGLLLALAHRPDILVLDEPSSGLDPIVRRDIMTAIIRTISEEGRSVLFSSHLLDEVERVSDQVAIINQGRIVLSDGLDQIRESFFCLTIRFETPQAHPPRISGTLNWKGAGHEWTAVCNGRFHELQDAVTAAEARIIEQRVPSLDECFVAQVGGVCSVSEAK